MMFGAHVVAPRLPSQFDAGLFLDDWECTRLCMNMTRPCLGVMIAHGSALYRNYF